MALHTGRKIAIGFAACVLVVVAAHSSLSDPVPTPGDAAQASAMELEFWQSVKAAEDPAELEAYLKAYPNGQFAPLARIRLGKLKGAGKQGASGEGSKTLAPAAGAGAQARPDGPAVSFLGITTRMFGETQARALGLTTPTGLEIEQVFHGLAADNGGLKAGDVLVSLNGTPIANRADVGRLLGETKPGDRVKVTFLRDRRQQTVETSTSDFFKETWEAAHRGHAPSMRTLGLLFAEGRFVELDQQQASYWVQRAVDAGDARAMHVLGERHFYGRGMPVNDALAFQWLQKAAAGGIHESQFLLAYMHGTGRGTPKNDPEAIRWYRLAAMQGNASAMFNLAIRHQAGRGVEQNLQLAAEWYEKAVAAGSLTAMSGLGWMYKYGKGGKPKDIAEAVRLFRLAADKGDGSGLHNLAIMYRDGEGVPRDLTEAIRLYRLAVEAGEERARRHLETLNASAHDPKEMQRLLSELGFDPGPIDGQPGPKTKQAIRDFQKTRGLTVDGEDSPRLVGQLRAALKQRKAAPKSAERTAGSEPAGSPDSGKPGDLKDLDSLD